MNYLLGERRAMMQFKRGCIKVEGHGFQSRFIQKSTIDEASLSESI